MKKAKKSLPTPNSYEEQFYEYKQKHRVTLEDIQMLLIEALKATQETSWTGWADDFTDDALQHAKDAFLMLTAFVESKPRPPVEEAKAA